MRNKAFLLLACILLTPQTVNASNKPLNASDGHTAVAGVIESVYSDLECTVKPNQTQEVECSKYGNLEEFHGEPLYTKQIMSVPPNNSFKSFMDAATITDKHSKQYKLKRRYKLDESGIYKVGHRLCIAIGQYYTKVVGTKIDVHMANGSTVKCIVAEIKDNKDTDKSNRQHKVDGSVIEFVVSVRCLPRKALLMGDCSYAIDELMGEIQEIAIIREVK